MQMDIVTRAQGLILKPKEEWEKIKQESYSISQLFTTYAMILAAIPAFAQFIGLGIVGRSIPWVGWYRYGVGRAFLYAVFLYVGNLVAVYVVGIVINALAPSFGSKQNQDNAMKLAVFSMTPAWVAGAFHIFPILGFLALLGSLYSLYVLYLGFNSSLMETPQDKVVTYLIVSVVIGIVIVAVVSMVIGGIFLVGAVGRV
jgi:hypothetical protein